MNERVACPHCATNVIPSNEGVCPACRRNVFQPPERATPAAPNDKIASADAVWKQFGDMFDLTKTPPDAESRQTSTSSNPTFAETASVDQPALAVDRFRVALATFTPRIFVTPAIVAANVIVFVVMAAMGISPFSPSIEGVLNWGANFGPKTLNGEWWRLLTSMFLHFGIIHLAFNMWVLWDVGKLLERLVGNFGFALLYVASGVVGSLTSLAWNSTVVSAGASGAVFGVVGGLAGFMALRRDTVPAPLLAHLRSSLSAFLIYNFLFGFIATGIDMAAHLGGFAAGLVCGVVMSHPLTGEGAQRRPRRNAVVFAMALVGVPAFAMLLPQAQPDVFELLKKMVVTERTLLDRYDELISQSEQKKMSESDTAARIDRDVLTPWRELRREMVAAENSPLVNRQIFSKLTQYLRMREESFELLVEGLRERDAGKMQRHRQQWDAADQLANQLTTDAS